MPGYNMLCPVSYFTVDFGVDGQTITYNFNTSGTYTINYVDHIV
jgi:hypothetical protein